MNEGSKFYKWMKAIPNWAKTFSSLIGAILALIGLSFLFQGNFYILAVVILPLLMITVLLLVMSIIVARTKSLARSGFGLFVLGRGIRIGAGLLVMTALILGNVYFASGPTALPVRTPTPIWTMTLHPSTTVTPSPLDLSPKPPGSASAASQTLVLIVVLVITLVIPFTRPGALNGRTLRDVSLGFVGWFLVNTLLWIWVDSSISNAHPSSGTVFFGNPERIMPLLLNIVALPILFLISRWITLGMFSAIIVNAIGTLLVTPVTAFYGDKMIIRIMAMIPFFLPPFFPTL